MTIDKLIDEYKILASNCQGTDYADKESVKRNNDSVASMYLIIDRIRDEFGRGGLKQLKTLLDIEDHGIKLWAATHLLARVTLDKLIEDKAFGIIEKVALGDDVIAVGYQYWIKDWKSKHGNNEGTER